jgi:circadian clock protein KaiC
MSKDDSRPAATGIAGLDDILRGGFPANHVYLIQGDPGTGKTTLGMQFLFEGRRLGESGMYISLSETGAELRAIARSHGWSLEDIRLFEMQSVEQHFSRDSENTLFEPSEVELREVMQRLLAEIDQVKATRVVFDSLSELRLLAQNPLRYRRQILMLKRYFLGRQCTVLFLDDRTAPEDDRQLQSIVHGVVLLEQAASAYGNERRRLRVVKMRGLEPRGGHHELAIALGGLRVFPRLVAAEHPRQFEQATLPSGVPELDSLLGGGVDRGTATLVIGPAGSGKSSLALRYALSAIERGEHVALFAFDERIDTLLLRARGLGLGLESAVRAGASPSSRSIRPRWGRVSSSLPSTAPPTRSRPGSSSSTASTATSTPCPRSGRWRCSSTSCWRSSASAASRRSSSWRSTGCWARPCRARSTSATWPTRW